MTAFQIVIPSRNQGAFIGEAIGSVLAQSRGIDLELVIIDACSGDETAEAIERALAGSHTVRARVVREPDGGQSEAINKGMRLGSGDVVSWLNADDRLLPGTLARMLEFWAAAGPHVAAVYGDTRYVDELGRSLFELREQGFRRRDLLWGPCYIAQPSCFVARHAWDAVGGLDERLHYAMDLDLWLRLSRIGTIVHRPQVLSEFRLHPTSKTVAAGRAARREAMQVRRVHGAVELGRVPCPLEVELRHVGVRARRWLRRSLGEPAGVRA